MRPLLPFLRFCSGAVANIFAADLINFRGKEIAENLSVELITLGSPRVFSAAKGDEIKSKLSSSYRLLNGNDPIPMTPLPYHTNVRHFGDVFHHNAEKKWIKKTFRDYHGGFGALIQKQTKKIYKHRPDKLAMDAEYVKTWEGKAYDGRLAAAPAARAEDDLKKLSRILANTIGKEELGKNKSKTNKHTNIVDHNVAEFLNDAIIHDNQPSSTKVVPVEEK